jgi:hypothetical protein
MDGGKTDQNEPSRNRGAACQNQGVAKTERVVRNAESNHHESGGGGQEAHDQQNGSHPVSSSTTHKRPSQTLKNCDRLPGHPQELGKCIAA